jgi:hypothetical protein
MQYFQGPTMKQIFGRSWRLADVLVALAADFPDLVVVALAADADDAAASAPVPTTAAARTARTSNVSLFIVPPPVLLSLLVKLYGRKDSDSGR